MPITSLWKGSTFLDLLCGLGKSLGAVRHRRILGRLLCESLCRGLSQAIHGRDGHRDSARRLQRRPRADTIGECRSGTLFYSTVLAYNDEKVGEVKPETIEDFFDLEKFPGRCGMRRSAAVNLEFALLADGVQVDEVYAVLDTEEGIERAFRKLDSIKDQVVWDGQVLDTGQLAIVAGTPRLEAAKGFLEFASRPGSIAAVGRYIAYSPAPRSADSLISTHAETGVDMRPHMPNAPQNTKRALRSDWDWWSEHADDMSERFVVWLLQ